MHLEPFPDPWDHLRLLTDGARNEAMIELLRDQAPEARVLEVGSGTGLLACVAARLGAREVFAVESSPLWREALRLVRENGLEHCVEVIPGQVAELAPREVDFAFADLLQADPLAGGLLEEMDAARRWVVPDGVIAPRRLRMFTAMVRMPWPEREGRLALEQVRRIGAQFDLVVGAIESVYRTAGRPRPMPAAELPISTAALVHDLAVGRGERPGPRNVEVVVEQRGVAGGAVVWFEAELADGLVLGNPPGRGGRWGQVVHPWPEPRNVEVGQRVLLTVTLQDGRLEVLPAVS